MLIFTVYTYRKEMYPERVDNVPELFSERRFMMIIRRYVSVVCAAALIAAALTVFAQAVLAVEPTQGVLQYSDSFGTDCGVWKTVSGKSGFAVKDGRLVSSLDRYGSASYLVGSENQWKDFAIEFELEFQNPFNASSGMLQIFTGYTNEKNKAGFYISPINNVSFMKLGKKYDCRIVRNSETKKVHCYFKDEGAADWEHDFSASYVSGVLSAGKYESGTIAFGASGYRVFIDDVRIYNLNETPVMITRKPDSVVKGKTKRLEFLNTSGDTAEFFSDNASVATVDAEGNITGVGAGLANITVTAGGYTDVCTVNVISVFSNIYTKFTQIQLHPGEIENVSFTGTPSGSTETGFIWRSSNERVVKIEGTNAKVKGIRAVGCGNAVITVASSLTGVNTLFYVTVVEKEEAPKESMATVNEDGYLIKKNVYGVGHPLSNLSGSPASDIYSATVLDFYRDLNIRIIRGPSGAGANNYDYTTSGYTLEGIYGISHSLDIPYCFAINALNQDADTIVTEIGEIVKVAGDRQIYIEMGNEVYGQIDVAKYMEKCKEVYTRVKPLYSNVKIGVVTLCEDIELKVSNQSKFDAYNETVASYVDYYDAVIPHYYTTLEDIDNLTEDEMMETLNAANRLFDAAVENHYTRFGGKEIWITEWGTYLVCVFKNSDYDEKNRLQFAKTTGVALHNGERLLDMLKSQKVDVAAYHCGIDPQGFGIKQTAGVLPNYYVFKALGELVNSYDYMYDVSFDAVTSKNTDVRCLQYFSEIYNVPDVGAWAFGSADGAEKIIVYNRDKNINTFSLSGKKIKKVWSYGGADALDGYLEPLESDIGEWNGYPDKVELPDTVHGNFVSSYELEPYSMTIFELEDGEELTAPVMPDEEYPVIPAYPELYSADFSNSEDYSTLEFPNGANSWKVINGELTYTHSQGYAQPVYIPIECDNFVLSFDCKKFTSLTKGTPTINIRTGVSDTGYGTFVLYADRIFYFDSKFGKFNDGGHEIGKFEFGMDEFYSFKFAFVDNIVSVYAKKRSDEEYSFVGQIDSYNNRPGGIEIKHMYTQQALDNIKIEAYLPFYTKAELGAESFLLNFSRSPQADTVNSENILLYADGEEVKTSLITDGSTVSVVPNGGIKPFTEYMITVTDRVRDGNGQNIFGGVYAKYFLTGAINGETVGALKFDAIRYFEYDGENYTEITDMKSGKIRTVAVLENLNKDTDIPCCVINVLYDSNGSLKDILKSEEIVVGAGGDYTLRFDHDTGEENNCIIKTFVWTNYDEMKPLAEGEVFGQNGGNSQ